MRHQIGNGITDRRDHALSRWCALSSADNNITLGTRNMSRIVARLFAVACQHTTSRSAVVAGRTPALIRLLSSSQGQGAFLWQFVPCSCLSDSCICTMLTCPSDNGKRISCIENATTRINDSATNLMSFLFYNRNVSVQDSKHSIHWLCAVFLKLKLMRWLDELIIMLDLCCWLYPLPCCRRVLSDSLWWHHGLAKETDCWAICRHPRERHRACEFCVTRADTLSH